MSSNDLSTTLLWQTLSKEVYVPGRAEKGLPPDVISEAQESMMESQPLLMSVGENKNVEKKRGCLMSIKQFLGGSTCCRRPRVLNNGASWEVAAFLLVNTALGVGILNFPAAYDQAGGLLYATLIQLIMVGLMQSTMLILAYCSDVNGDLTYHDVLLSMCGKKGQQMAAVSITLTLYCVCIASLIVIGDQVDNLFYTIFGPGFCEHFYLRRTFTISVISICFILPTCFCKRVDFLGYIGSIGIFAMLYPVFLTVYGYFKLTPSNVIIKTRPTDLSEMFSMFPVLGLGYQCQEVVVPVYSCMRERNLFNFAKSSVFAMGFLFVVYSIIGCFGYLTFGSHVAHNVMKMYDAKDPFVMVGVIALIIKMVTTYPILALCGRDAASGIYAELRGLKPSELAATEKPRRYAVAALWFASSLLLAVSTESIGVVFKYLGSVASANIFIYPGICLLQMVLKQDPEFQRRRSPYLVFYAIFICGVGAFCVGVTLSEAILSGGAETTVDLCHLPINATLHSI